MHARFATFIPLACLACLWFSLLAAAQSRPTVVLPAPSQQPAQPERAPAGTAGQRAQSLLGLAVFLVAAIGIGWARGARRLPWRVLLWGLVLQFIFGAVVLYSPRLLEVVICPTTLATQSVAPWRHQRRANDPLPSLFGTRS